MNRARSAPSRSRSGKRRWGAEPVRGAARALDRLSGALDRVALAGAILAVVAMAAMAGWQAVARYILDQPPVWTEELARYAMVWAGLLGASCAYRAAADPTLFPGMAARGGAWAVLRALGTALFVLPVLYYALFGPGWTLARGYIARSWGRSADTVDLPMGVFALAIPVAFALITLHVLAALATALGDRKAGS